MDAAAELRKKRVFRKYSFRGVDLDDLLEMPTEKFVTMLNARARRVFQRGLKTRALNLIKKIRASKLAATGEEKPVVVKTHLRNMIIVPEMFGAVVGVHNGRFFNQVEIKPDMVGHYLGEFSMTYSRVLHGSPGVGATNSSKNVALK